MDEENHEENKEDAEDLDIFKADIGVKEDSEEKVTQAKEVEIEKWREENVFDEVQDKGQNTISMIWVVTY